jgi:hypothetical protein
MNRLSCLAIALATMIVSGCVTFEEPAETTATTSATGGTTGTAGSSAGSGSSSGGSMTAKEASAVSSGPCTGRSSVLFADPSVSCASKTIWLEGDISLKALPVDLTSFNGNIEVKGGTGGVWNLTVVLQARGDTDASARGNLDNIAFTWSHEAGGSHHLTAEAKKKNQLLNNQESARMTLIMPASVVLDLSGATTNGEATARGIQAKDLELSSTNGRVAAQDLEAVSITLQTTNGEGRVNTVSADRIEVTSSNGAIDVTATAHDYKLQTSNGGIEAKLKPSGNGTITIGTTNGPVDLLLVEDAQHGHDLKATTSNGMVTISLKDGSQSGPTMSKTFKTTGYAGRAIQTKTTVTSTNSIVTVSPF